MQLPLSGPWQISPLTDLSIPQADLFFPAAFSQVLPDTVSEQSILEQEWHLMHDFLLEESQLAFPCIDIVFQDIAHYAEVRVNGVAALDCDGSKARDSKNVRGLLQAGGNRIEILFLEQDDDWLLEEEEAPSCALTKAPASSDKLGIWQQPYLQLIRHAKLTQVTTEQIWHHGGGCEFKVDLFFETFQPGLVSASVSFDGRTYQLPLDMRSNQTSALFQIEAPLVDVEGAYQLDVHLDGQHFSIPITLDTELCARHFPID
ncbi:hypothetical protein [Vibrio sp. SCSIO 43136]|uniref:glycosyl hydrolase 2 galactose-binding domain-containing protein n=1 Tax=Vibrio sp. SCSIO 43136 TaxID=2819101 RepID=UPI002074C298|nr:hypothetical protein [Vibrio sp. SCSIO 43136]USD65583.1 hypothetical protein J4N39_01645 [Vibrio sp. SCSIO 43136]